MVGIRPGGPGIGLKLKEATPVYEAPVAPAAPKRAAPKAKKASAPSGPSAAQQAQAAADAAAAQARAEAAAAQARAQQAANNNARATANQNINQLNQQITAKDAQRSSNLTNLEALKKLVGGGLQQVRDTQLTAIDSSLKTKLAQLQQTFDSSLRDFRANEADNNATEADASFANIGNRAREKGDLLTQALSQGAGESDLLRSQMQALRNWSANQGDVNRSFYDTQSSINAGITDLNNATKTGRINEEQSANASRGDIWDQFYGSTADTYTQMSNLDQQNYLLGEEITAAEQAKGQSTALLDWLNSGRNYDEYVEPQLPSVQARKPGSYTSPYAEEAAKAAGSTWTNPGVSDETKGWKGATTTNGALTSSQSWNATDNVGSKKRPEGAGLRKW